MSPKLICQWSKCPESYTQFGPDQLYRHVLTLHTPAGVSKKKARTKCRWNRCGRRLKGRSLYKHLLIHIPKYPYHCEACKTKYAYENVLKKHLKSYSHAMHVRDPKGTCIKNEITRKLNILLDELTNIQKHLTGIYQIYINCQNFNPQPLVNQIALQDIVQFNKKLDGFENVLTAIKPLRKAVEIHHVSVLRALASKPSIGRASSKDLVQAEIKLKHTTNVLLTGISSLMQAIPKSSNVPPCECLG